MTRLLASVTDVEEAIQALECGADIIDLKNPGQGALGALPLSVIKEIVRTIAGRKPISATIGDLPMHPEMVVDAVNRVASTGVDIVKIGFFGDEGHAECVEALQQTLDQGVRVVAVLFADANPPLQRVPMLAEAGFYGVMLDTAVKDGKRLCHHMNDQALQSFVGEAQALNLLTGLAGSLALEDLSGLLSMKADYLGFRGALCNASRRTARLEPARLSRLLDVLHYYNTRSEELVG